MSADISAILAERGRSHGDFTTHAECVQALKREFNAFRNGRPLSAVQREAIDMILHKLGRIAAGNADHVDHWDDIAGYAKLVSQRLPSVLPTAEAA